MKKFPPAVSDTFFAITGVWMALLGATVVTVSDTAQAIELACIGGSRDVSNSYEPHCFNPRTDATIHAMLIHYGSAMSAQDLARIQPLLMKRFQDATGGLLKLDIVESRIIPLKSRYRNLEQIAAQIPGGPEKHLPARLTRLWSVFFQKGSTLAPEIHDEMIQAGLGPQMAKTDAVLVLSEAQFEGLGFASGAFAITKQPSEVAWGAADGGTTRFETDARLIDELTHELGHVLGLTHPSQECQIFPPITLEKLAGYQQCCDQSPAGSDVMSYCRKRADVSPTVYFGFTECTRNFIQDQTIPSLLRGGIRPLQTRFCL